MREAGTLIDFASRYCVMPIGFKKSSSRISPGGTGSISRIKSPFVIVDHLYIVGIAGVPSKADAPLIVDPDAMLAGPVALQRFQSIAGWHSKEIESRRCI